MTQSTFEHIYKEHYAGLVAYGQAITIDIQIIEDTIQEMFLGFWKNQNELTDKSSLDNYLLVCFRNRLIKKLNTFRIVELKLDIPDENGVEPNLHLEESLQSFIDQLPTHQKEVIYLRYYKNKSYQEIGEILGIKYQVARNFSYRGIKSLKNKIDHSKDFQLNKAL